MIMTASQTIRLETELLILGTGAAGCGAALAARQAGIRTLMVDKGKLESSGCLGGGNDHFIAVLNTDEPQDTIVYTTDGSSFALHLDANEIKWYEI